MEQGGIGMVENRFAHPSITPSPQRSIPKQKGTLNISECLL